MDEIDDILEVPHATPMEEAKSTAVAAIRILKTAKFAAKGLTRDLCV